VEFKVKKSSSGKVSIEVPKERYVSKDMIEMPGDVFARRFLEYGKDDEYVKTAVKIFGKERCRKWFIEYCEKKNIQIPEFLRK